MSVADTTFEDATLLRRIASGDADALMALHQRYAAAVYSMARRVLGERHLAEEVTQDIFLKIWQKSQRYDPARGRFSAWLLSATRFAAIDRLRQEGRQPLRSASSAEPTDLPLPAPEGQADWERGYHLRLLCQHLPAEQRELIDLAYFGGMTHHELAEYLGLPLGTVKSRLRLGLQKLRALWLEGTSPSSEEGL